MTDPRRSIPSVDALLVDASFVELASEHGRERVLAHLRTTLAAARAGADGVPLPVDPAEPRYWADAVRAAIERQDHPSLRPVLNATGVVLHTNLGRAPLPQQALEAMVRVARGYANLEYDLDAGARGSRYDHCAALLADLSGAAAALVVNNAAAGLLLALTALARGRGVAVSRGELVEIGGGFRIPDILERSGARLIEVGSTNRTRVRDYRDALESGAAHAILKVHRSNFAMSGFVEEATVAELADLGRATGVPVVHDLGSGLFVDAAALGLPEEPRAEASIDAGVDVVVVSGDKLFGGPQAGIVLGSRDAVERLRRDPLCRALRVDKATLAALEATARLYRDRERAVAAIPTLAMLSVGDATLEARARSLAERLAARGVIGARVDRVDGRVGGGTYPGASLPSWAVVLEPERGVERLAAALRAGEPPVVARIDGARVLLDVRTVPAQDEAALLDCVVRAASEEAG